MAITDIPDFDLAGFDLARLRSCSASILLFGPVSRCQPAKESAMQRLKSMGHSPPPPRPGGSWLAGLVISTAIMTMATQAILLGTGAAIRDATLKGD
jgi:hypothetical protein